jgi:hypothetical protein
MSILDHTLHPQLVVLLLLMLLLRVVDKMVFRVLHQNLKTVKSLISSPWRMKMTGLAVTAMVSHPAGSD